MHSVNVEISGIHVVSVSVVFVTEGKISQSPTVVTKRLKILEVLGRVDW